MEPALISKGNDCKDCYKCIRKCPTKSISFLDNKAKIIHDECILCGKCFLACPQNAKEIRSDIERVKGMINAGFKVIVSLAPSFIANFYPSNFNDVKEALLKLGFFAVEETALGADSVKKAYDEILSTNGRDIVISSCCTTVNLLIQKHYPELLKYLADVLTPMDAHAKDIKERYPEAKVVFVGPCIAKKYESDQSKYTDVALTYLEIAKMFKDAHITLNNSNEIKDGNNNSKSRLFPTCGGIISSMKADNSNYKYIAIDGIENCIEALKDIERGNVHHCFIEMSSCSGSCINGPAILYEARNFIKNNITIKEYAGTADFIHNKESKYKDINNQFSQIYLSHATPSEEEISRCLLEMGKTSKNKELNCGCCGYNTCRDKAIAIIQGKAVKEMCLPYLMEKARSFSNNIVYNSPNGLMVLDEDFNIQLLNKSMNNIIGVKDTSSLIGKNVTTIFDTENYYKVLSEDSKTLFKKEYLSEYDKYVEETVVYDTKFHIIISIMKDITASEIENQKREELVKKSLDITNKVIDKNMRAVQEIASLLGESAAETKVALSSLKDTLKDDK